MGTRGWLVSAALALAAAGCLSEPKIEDRWTRVDMTGASLAPSQPVQAGTTIPVQVSSDVYYRHILTGYAVAELRASTVFSAGTLVLDPNADRLRMASDMDRLLATSVSMGREARAVTGWDHLIQHIDFAFTGSVPGSVTDSLRIALTALALATNLVLAGAATAAEASPMAASPMAALPMAALPKEAIPKPRW